MSSMMGSLNGTLNGTLANLTIMDEGTMDTLDSIGNATLALNVTQITEQVRKLYTLNNNNNNDKTTTTTTILYLVIN